MKKKEIVLRSPADLDNFNYPEKKSKNLTDTEYFNIKNNLEKNVRITPESEIIVNKKGIPKILLTDPKGANKFVNNLDDDQKLKNGTDKFVKLSPLQQELSKRIQEPRDSLTREKLKENEYGLMTIRDTYELEKGREIDYQRIRNELPKLKEKKMKAENISTDDITGEPLKPNAVAHHIERKADNPKQALNLDNIALLNQDTHIEGHQSNFEGKENYDNFKNDKQKRSDKNIV